MDGFGKNRFELLCLDDDATDPSDAVVRKKVKQTSSSANTNTVQPLKNQNQKNNGFPSTTGSSSANNDNLKLNVNKNINKKSTSTAGGGTMAEKENKSSAMNKNDKKYSGGQRDGQTTGTGVSGGVGKQSQNKLGGTQQRNVNFKQQNGEVREQRNNRRNRDDINNIKSAGNRIDRNNDSMSNTGGGLGASNNDNADQQQRPMRRDRRDNDNRGPPRNRNYDGGKTGKREFDRQSGSDKTGVKAIDKKDGAGGYNWGSPKQDIEDLNKSNTDEALTDKEDFGTETQKNETTGPIEEETKELTLDEWKAQKQQRAKPQFNIRKAGEGEDLSQWKKMVALDNKVKRKGESDEEELEYDPSMYPQRVGRLQRIMDIEFHFNDGRRGGGMGRGRGGRGQRGGNAGGGSAGGGVGAASGGGAVGGGNSGNNERSGNPGQRQRPARERRDGDRQRGGQHAPKVDDERQFPTLS